MRKPASQWSREDVAEWVTGLGDWATKNYSTLFLSEVRREENIEGDSLQLFPLSPLSLFFTFSLAHQWSPVTPAG